MKREEIHVMEAGEDLDDLVHVHVMGGCLHDEGFEGDSSVHHEEGPFYRCKKGCGYGQIVGIGIRAVLLWPRPKYSTEIARAWEVVEALRARRQDLVLNDGSYQPITYEIQAGLDAHGPWTFCCFALEGGINARSARAATAPLAICRAALLTTLSEEEYAEGRRWPDGIRVQDGNLVQA